MAGDLSPEDILGALEGGRLEPFYLFYGPGEFRLERVLERIREDFIPQSARDFNLEICYGGETDPSDIVNRAQTLPFMARNRLIVVRRTEEFSADQLERFVPYLEDPAGSTCLIFITSRTDFKRRFYKKIRASGRAVNFTELKESQVVPWIRRTAGEMGLDMESHACVHLQQIAGNRLRDLHSELVKLSLRYGNSRIGEEQVKELAIHSRVYSIFELMNAVSAKDLGRSISVLNRFLEEEDKRSAPLQLLGMLNRQIKLLWQTKAMIERGGKSKDVAAKLGIPAFSIGKLIKQARLWSVDEFERGISLLYGADRLLKTGSRPKVVLENLILSLCG